MSSTLSVSDTTQPSLTGSGSSQLRAGEEPEERAAHISPSVAGSPRTGRGLGRAGAEMELPGTSALRLPAGPARWPSLGRLGAGGRVRQEETLPGHQRTRSRLSLLQGGSPPRPPVPAVPYLGRKPNALCWARQPERRAAVSKHRSPEQLPPGPSQARGGQVHRGSEEPSSRQRWSQAGLRDS